VLDPLGVPYALIGAHAVNVWLEPRFTADVDITAASTPEEMERLRQGLVAAGFHVAREHGAALPSGPDFVRFAAPDGAAGRLTLRLEGRHPDRARAPGRRLPWPTSTS